MVSNAVAQSSRIAMLSVEKEKKNFLKSSKNLQSVELTVVCVENVERGIGEN